LGENQWEWLEQELASSTAEVILLGTGSLLPCLRSLTHSVGLQFLPTDKVGDKFHNYRSYDRFAIHFAL
jgi:hypothetical protein